MTAPKKTYDVAVLGWWYGKNYGSILTYYGLNRAIDSLGRSVLMVHESLGYNGWRVKWPDDILSMQFARRIGYEYTQQVHYSELPELNKVARTFVVGSDQLWNPLVPRVNDDLFLDFVEPENNRVAYATSFGNRGTDKFKAPFVAKHADNLQDFKAISVREEYAVDTARDIFGAKASLVVDPVFLLPKEHYTELADKATVAPEGEYLAVFFLDPTEQKKSVAQSIATKLGFEKILVIPNPDEGRESAVALFADEPRAEILAEDAPENFLRAYRDAAYVVTDSFHGSAFATIFEKPFSSIFNTKRGADRFKNLMAALGFGESRRVVETDTLEKITANANVTREIDFTQAREYITTGRAASLEWLNAALDPDQKGSAAIAPRERFLVKDPAFTAANSGWKVSHKGGQAVLRVGRGGAAKGNHVWTDLPTTLEAGANYRLKIDWTPRTAADKINLHLRNGSTGDFRVVAPVKVAGGSGEARTDTVTFSVDKDGFSQLMLGGLHFTGRKAGADVASIELVKAGTAPVLAQAAAAEPDAAEPTLSAREQAVQRVANDPALSTLKDRITAELPEVALHVGRDMKEVTLNEAGGPADLLALPDSIDDLKSLIDLAHEIDVPFIVLGRGTDVAVRDAGVRGLVILTTRFSAF